MSVRYETVKRHVTVWPDPSPGLICFLIVRSRPHVNGGHDETAILVTEQDAEKIYDQINIDRLECSIREGLTFEQALEEAGYIEGDQSSVR